MNLWSGRTGVGIVGYVVMPNHIHVLVRPVEPGCLTPFLRTLKSESSRQILEYLEIGGPNDLTPFADRMKDSNGNIHVWQSKSYGFNIFNPTKAIEKLEYMHANPVRAGLVDDQCLWRYSSASYFLKGTASPVRLVPYDGPLPKWLVDSVRARKKD